MKPSDRIQEILREEIKWNRENPLPGRPPIDTVPLIIRYLDEQWEAEQKVKQAVEDYQKNHPNVEVVPL